MKPLDFISSKFVSLSSSFPVPMNVFLECSRRSFGCDRDLRGTYSVFLIVTAILPSGIDQVRSFVSFSCRKQRASSFLDACSFGRRLLPLAKCNGSILTNNCEVHRKFSSIRIISRFIFRWDSLFLKILFIGFFKERNSLGKKQADQRSVHVVPYENLGDARVRTLFSSLSLCTLRLFYSTSWIKSVG